MYAPGRLSSLMRSKRGLFVFFCGLLFGLVGFSYWHTKKVLVPELQRNRHNRLVGLIKVHNTRIDPNSVVLLPIHKKKPSFNTTTFAPFSSPAANIKLHERPPTTPPPSLKIKPEQSRETPVPTQDNSKPQNRISSIRDVKDIIRVNSWPTDKQLVDLIPRPKAQNANCTKIFANDKVEIDSVFKKEEEQKKVPVPDEEYAKLAENCDFFKKSRGYVSHPLSQEEEDYPLAYSIMMFKDVEQFERLLRAIYMPQNYYCIHVDSKSNQAIQKSVAAITKCFDNVNLASRQVDVQWASFSVVEADLICMEDLYKKYKKWKYFINLTGQEFPIKTNHELVKILKVFNGAVNMEGTEKRRNVERTQIVHNGFYPVDPRIDKTPVPHNIRLTKGSVHVVVPREFVEFALFNSVAKEFQAWVKDTGVPDETYFTSLGHSPHLGVPGSYKGEPETNKDSYPFLVRYKNWGTYPFDFPCAGERVRMICITSVGDLHIIKDRPELFINKFHIDYSPSAYDCLEQLHFQRMRDEVLGSRKLDLTFYQKLDFVKNHV